MRRILPNISMVINLFVPCPKIVKASKTPVKLRGYNGRDRA